MSELARWSRTRPLQRNLVLAGLGLVVLVGLVLALGATNPRAQPRQRSATSAPTLETTPRPTHAPADELAEAFAEARPVAVAFLEAYAGYRWDDPPAALRERLRPYDTPSLDASLGAGSGAAAAQAGRADHHEVAVGQVLELRPLALEAESRLRLAGLVRQQLGDDAGQREAAASVALLLIRTETGWRVDQVQL